MNPLVGHIVNLKGRIDLTSTRGKKVRLVSGQPIAGFLGVLSTDLTRNFIADRRVRE